jgi:hypothetical protein
MNTRFLTHWMMKWIGDLMVWGLALALIAPLGMASADDGTPPPDKGQAGNPGFERQYQRLKITAAGQTVQLDRANNTAANTQTWIDQLRTQGKEVTALDTALAAYRAALTTAQGQHATAQGILNTHAGFDDNGQVTNREAAKVTIKTARQSLTDAQLMLKAADIALRQALRAWRQANPK